MIRAQPTDDRAGFSRWRTAVGRFVLIASAALLTSGLPAQAPQSGAADADDIVRSADNIEFDASAADDLTLAGDRVRVRGMVSDDLLAIGGDISSTANVDGDSLTAGRDVDLEGTVAQSVFALAMDLAITGTVGDDLYAAGANVEIADSAVIEGDALIAGDDVAIDGRISEDLRIAASDTRIAGIIGGNVTIHGNEVRVLPDARIDGTLTVTSPEPPEVADSAVIRGGVRHVEAEEHESRSSPILEALGSWFFGTVAATIVGTILVFMIPSISTSISGYLVSRPLASFGIGLLFAIAAFPVAILLAITIVGIPFAFALFGGFMFAILAAIPMFAAGMAIYFAVTRDQDRPKPLRRTIAWLAAISAILALIGLIPVAGPILLGVAATTAIGAFVKSLWDVRHAFGIQSASDMLGRAAT